MSGFDWSALLRVGAAGGLKPAEFWSLTPAELVLVLGLEAVEKPLNRARLEELERMYWTESMAWKAELRAWRHPSVARRWL